MKTAFISGHLDLTEEEFDKYYKPRIIEALNNGHNFVVGDARGADFMAQKFLFERIDPTIYFDRVIVYHAFTSPRNNKGFLTQHGFLSQTAKDKAMTKDSDYDIAWVREGKEKSGTQRNLDRRKTK